jgi:hypothetical protein
MRWQVTFAKVGISFPTGGGRSVGVVRLRTKGREVELFVPLTPEIS